MTADPFDLNRFVAAQSPVFQAVLTELQAGRKQTHWMWFIFPQLRGLGHSSMAQCYGIGSVEEARAYLDHALLGDRLTRCVQIVVECHAGSLHGIFGSPDDLKFVSSMTLFEAAAPSADNVFAQALVRWCDGRRDARTLQLLQTKGPRIAPGASTV